MDNSLKLISGQKYSVIKPFTDYDNVSHSIGETWIFIKTNFSPYDDGLTLHVKYTPTANEVIYRLQWRAEEQQDIIENFKDFVKIC